MKICLCRRRGGAKEGKREASQYPGEWRRLLWHCLPLGDHHHQHIVLSPHHHHDLRPCHIKWVAGRGESILEERALWKFSSGSSDQQHQLVSPGGSIQPSLGAILEVESNLVRSDPAEHLVRYHSTDPLVK